MEILFEFWQTAKKLWNTTKQVVLNKVLDYPARVGDIFLEIVSQEAGTWSAFSFIFNKVLKKIFIEPVIVFFLLEYFIKLQLNWSTHPSYF